MANRGFDYEEILLHYYTGTYLDRRVKWTKKIFTLIYQKDW
jgi:peptidoglycan hydrolase-like amidase